MEVVLLIIAGLVLYILYNSLQNYMKNPYTIAQSDYKAEYDISENPYIQESSESKIARSEYGVLVGILQCLAQSDGEICALEKELLRDMLDDISAEMMDYPNAREMLQKIFDENKESLDNLAQSFVELTKGEYKKRLKVVEFLLVLAYADGILSEVEREKIIDVAAIFEITNEDFNAMYDEFENLYASGVEMDEKRAMEILGISENSDENALENAYQAAIKANKQNILLSKNLNKHFKDNSLPKLREIDEAYKILRTRFQAKH